MKVESYITLNNKGYSKIEAANYALEMRVKSEFERHLGEFLLFLLDDERRELAVNTSGSTGPSKQIFIKKEQFYASALATLTFLGLKENDSALLALPVKYIGGKMMLCRALVGKLNLNIQQPSTDVLSKIKLAKPVDFAALTPAQVYPALNDATALANLKMINCLIIGGAAVSLDLNMRLCSLPNRIYETYGMTETISHIALRQIAPTSEDHFTCLPGVEIRTDDLNRLIIHAPALGIQQLQTTDVIELKSATTFIWKGRYDHVINSGGIKINPEEEEKKLAPFLGRQVVLSSIPNDTFGEQLVLVFEGSELSSNEKESMLEELKMAELMAITPKIIRVFPFYPRTENGKINRTVIRELLKPIEDQGK